VKEKLIERRMKTLKEGRRASERLLATCKWPLSAIGNVKRERFVGHLYRADIIRRREADRKKDEDAGKGQEGK